MMAIIISHNLEAEFEERKANLGRDQVEMI